MSSLLRGADHGQGIVEYGLILGLVALAAVSMLTFTGISISSAFADAAATISGIRP